MGRRLGERLSFEAEQIRKELRKEISKVSEADLDWAPAEGMKSYRALLKEIGAMQVESTILVDEGWLPSYEQAEERITGATVEQLMASLDENHRQLLGYLAKVEDSVLNDPIEVPKDWEGFFGTTQLEPEELVRWICRHEYYHQGQ